MWLTQVLYYKLKYFVPDSIIRAHHNPAAHKTQDKIIHSSSLYFINFFMIFFSLNTTEKQSDHM